MDPTPISGPGSTRKRVRENESESQRHKREKAAERQRRKRERDRQAGLNNLLINQVHQQQQQPPIIQPPPPPPPEEHPNAISAPAAFHTQDLDKDDQLSPDDAAKRERVRAAARERQRKHRALVKQKKLRELGLDMGNELLPNMEEVQYRLNADGQYQPMLQELQQHAQHHPQQHMHEPPFPQGQPLGGQTFASTLLLSFSCAPLLKAHLLRTLNMSNEELASLEPIIAQAWDHWDQQRRMHFAHPNNAPKPPDANQPVPDGSVSAPFNTIPPHPHPYVHDPTQGSPNDFRARFHRSLVAPVPFRTGVMGTEAQQPGMPSASAPVPGQNPNAPQGVEPMDTTNANLDPQLGQARDEAVGVAKQLERS
ncbi:hypothetical protein BDY19DRAFT_986749 [Irpex rosettiformis]|uniref:Uncharacterized protein n=1 Tax=Irpex rosettiformis TaxID=378272 RepID=A0ACB8TW32_9APHY|nr:hypothetical protein BDY19DRAFT_986749 [Irpex rosettiformis]